VPYNITKSNGTPLVTVQDNTVNTSASSLALIGRNALNFGQGLNDNFVSLMQNFSSVRSPNNPLQGQLWYNPAQQTLSVYDGISWKTWTPAFNGITGVASVNLNAIATILFATVYQNQIITVTSHKAIPSNLLPHYVVINGFQYNFATLFPNGILPGVNIPFQYSNNFTYGTSTTDNATVFDNDIGINGTALAANTFVNSPTITLTGSLYGNAIITGSSNVNIPANMSNVYINDSNKTVGGVWSNVTVSDTGIVTGVSNVSINDIFLALGYPTIDTDLMSVTNIPNTMVARDVNANFEANIMFGTATSAFSFSKPVMLGINGDAVGAVSFDGTTDVTIQTNLAPVENLEQGSYNVLKVNNTGRVVSAMVVDNMPIGSLVLIENENLVPTGWVLCYGQTIILPDGGEITAPDLSNVTVLGNQYIMRIS